jgi:hypothetical protein
MSKRIDGILLKIEALLVSHIPKVVKAAKLREPVYCLRIWYNGTDSLETAVPWLMLVKESTRKSFIRKHGKKAPYYIWCADEATNDESTNTVQSFNVQIDNEELVKQYGLWYEHLCDLDDDEELQPFREMSQRVAAKLNTLDWSAIVPVTDDFVVFPADGSHTFCDDLGDLNASVPEERLNLLRSRNLLGPAE